MFVDSPREVEQSFSNVLFIELGKTLTLNLTCHAVPMPDGCGWSIKRSGAALTEIDSGQVLLTEVRGRSPYLCEIRPAYTK